MDTVLDNTVEQNASKHLLPNLNVLVRACRQKKLSINKVLQS